MKTVFKPAFTFMIAVAALSSALHAFATDVIRAPLPTNGIAKPNVVFGLDDSLSMDFEVLLPTNDGRLWWETSSRSAWRNGQPMHSGNDSKSMVSLFPNGCAADARHACDEAGHYAIPPLPLFATVRSAAYNPIYYDPSMTYRPWSFAVVNGRKLEFAPADPQSALSHPLYPNGATLDLTAQQFSTAANRTYQYFAGMEIPAGAKKRTTRNGPWEDVAAAEVIGSGKSAEVALSYYPATYWVPATCTPDAASTPYTNVSCTLAPDGKTTLKRYEIKSGVQFPSGRSYADELQNFANWFTYYRKRTFTVSSSMSVVMDTLTGMRLGVVLFNNHAPVTMYDTDSSDPFQNGRAVLGKFYANSANGGTPTRQTLNYIGSQFTTNRSIMQFSCQRNAAFMLTDGYADTATGSAVAPPAYDKRVYGAKPPFDFTYSGSIADIALSYYTNNIRPDLTAGRVPAATESLDPAADKNPNPHMNTYGLSLGALGNIWPGLADPYKFPPKWANPNQDASADSIDDLWHATINGRGAMFLATTPRDTAEKIQAALTQILRLSGSQSGVTYSTVNLKTGNSFAYAGSYKPMGWSGDIEAFQVDPLTGSLAVQPLWSANKKLMARSWSSRKIATSNASGGQPFDASAFASNALLANYLRGDRTEDGLTFRFRTGLIGAVINAEPVVSLVDSVVFAASNEGMLHALDMNTGEELWAYAPSFALAEMQAQSAPGSVFRTILDATPVMAKVGSKKILVGGAGTAGPGFYALDVTDPRIAPSDIAVAARVLWEFPNANTPEEVRKSVGTSLGKPMLVNTKEWGWVALVTSGYNSTLDGKGRLFVLDAETGVLKHTFVTTQGSVGSGDAGLAQVSGWLEVDSKVRFVYGGDELGNMWRFDLDAQSVSKLATLVDSQGTPLPVTAAPELYNNNGRRMVLIGTGRLLGASDVTDTRVQTFFGLWDNNTPITDVRAQLTEQTFTVEGNVRKGTSVPVNWSTKRGWRVDLPAGEKANTDPSVAYGVLAFTTNKPNLDACNVRSALYLLDAGSGGQLSATAFVTGVPYTGMEFGSTLSSRPSVARTESGRIVVTARQSDGTTNSRLLNIAGAIPPHKNAWREVLR